MYHKGCWSLGDYPARVQVYNRVRPGEEPEVGIFKRKILRKKRKENTLSTKKKVGFKKESMILTKKKKSFKIFLRGKKCSVINTSIIAYLV